MASMRAATSALFFTGAASSEFRQLSTAGNVPSWCKWVPAALKQEACHEVSGCPCEEWCSNIAKITHRFVPACCGCGVVADGLPESIDGNTTTEPATTQEPSGPKRPGWCRFMPEATWGPKCKTESFCECQEWCATTPTLSWQWNPSCCGCAAPDGGIDGGELGDDSEDPAAEVPADGRAPAPAWCRWVPEAFQKEICRGSQEGCGCQDWCGATPESSRKWNPECCGCSSGNNITSDASAVPRWCRYVPEAVQGDRCKNGGRCNCEEWCSVTPPKSQAWNPACCGCETADFGSDSHLEGASSGATDIPAWCLFVPEAKRGDGCKSGAGNCRCDNWCRATPPGTRKWSKACCGCEDRAEEPDSSAKPKWCKYMPEALHGSYCEEGSDRCECKFWCPATPAVSQGWNPKCCGCAAAKWDSRKGDEVVPADSQNSSFSRPAWCQWVPNAVNLAACTPQGKDGDKACECASWCWAMPRSSHQWNPKCCGCEGDDSDREVVNGAKPGWCKYMPPATHGKFCKGDEVCHCKGWCASTPKVSRGWNPECCGCPEEDNGADVGDGEHVEGDGEVPAWCKWVPDAFKRDRCTNGTACECDDFCDRTPSDSDKWNPKCCGCQWHGDMEPGQETEDLTSLSSRMVVGAASLACILVAHAVAAS